MGNPKYIPPKSATLQGHSSHDLATIKTPDETHHTTMKERVLQALRAMANAEFSPYMNSTNDDLSQSTVISFSEPLTDTEYHSTFALIKAVMHEQYILVSLYSIPDKRDGLHTPAGEELIQGTRICLERSAEPVIRFKQAVRQVIEHIKNDIIKPGSVIAQRKTLGTLNSSKGMDTYERQNAGLFIKALRNGTPKMITFKAEGGDTVDYCCIDITESFADPKVAIAYFQEAEPVLIRTIGTHLMRDTRVAYLGDQEAVLVQFPAANLISEIPDLLRQRKSAIQGELDRLVGTKSSAAKGMN